MDPEELTIKGPALALSAQALHSLTITSTYTLHSAKLATRYTKVDAISVINCDSRMTHDSSQFRAERPFQPAHPSAPAHSIFGPLRSDFRSAHMLRL